MTPTRKHPRGFVLPATLLFLAIAFGIWAVLFRSSASFIRVEQARVLRSGRNAWSAPALAIGLRLLETGTPPVDSYACKTTITQDGQTKYFLITFEHTGSTQWTVQCAPTTDTDPHDDAPASF